MKHFAAILLFVASALAAPEAYIDRFADWKNSWKETWAGKDKGRNCPAVGPIKYTSTISVVAVPGQVVNGTNPTGGQAGAIGYYDFGLNSDYNLICYHIKLCGFGDATYQSPARTATHIHEAAKGQSGPPRIAFPNPVAVQGQAERVSVGCLQGPFTTGLNNTAGQDQGANFHVRQIEQNPAAFFADVHTNIAVPGAVRGQLA